MTFAPIFHRGAFLCENYELRITARCLVNDLGLLPTTTFEEALPLEIVDALVAKRQRVPIGAKTVGPQAGAKTLYHLGVGDDHRGATWFDPVERVVWLCGAGSHRSGNDADFFQQIRPHIASGAVYPALVDYKRMLGDRVLRFAELGPVDAEQLINEARANPNQIVSGVLARDIPVRISVEPGPDLDAIYVGFSADVIAESAQKLNLVIRCFDPIGEMAPEYLPNMPNEPEIHGEFVMLIVRRALPDANLFGQRRS